MVDCATETADSWTWADADAWGAAGRAALRAWVQGNRRELGFLGQRQLEQAAEELAVASYVVIAGELGLDLAAELRLPCAGSHVKGSQLALTMSGSTSQTGEGALVSAHFEMIMNLDGLAAGAADNANKQLIVCFEAGAHRNGHCQPDEGKRSQRLVERPALGLDSSGGISAVRIYIDSVAVARCRDLVIPALEELPDVVDMLCSLPLLLPPNVRKMARQMAIEELVEEVCWNEEEEGDDEDGLEDADSENGFPDKAQGVACAAAGTPCPQGKGHGGKAGSGEGEEPMLSRKDKRVAKRGKLSAGTGTHLVSNATLAALGIRSEKD